MKGIGFCPMKVGGLSGKPVSSAVEAKHALDAATEASVAPGDTLSATYHIPAAVPSGTYAAWGTLRISWTPTDDERPTPPLPFPFQVALQVPPVSTG